MNIWRLPILLGVIAAAMYPATRGGFKIDDAYVLANAASPRLSQRLFVWNVDRPSPSAGAWYDGVTVQRRFVRLLPSALIAGEVAVFGANPQALHFVSLGLHLLNCLLVFALIRRWLRDEWKVLMATAVFGLHPIAAEPVGHLAAQAVLVATTASLVAVYALVRYRERPGPAWLWVLGLATATTLTSYEAAIGLPLLLVMGDVLLTRGTSLRPAVRLAPRILVLVQIPLMLIVSGMNRRDVSASEMSYRPAFAEVWYVGRTDLENYLLKAVGVLNPRDNEDYWLHNAAGEPVAAAAAVVLVLAVVWWGRRRRLAWLGILTFAIFLAPPYLIRATVGIYNFPTHRQLYLPLLGVAILVAAWLADTRRGVALLVVLPVLVIYAMLAATVGRFNLEWSDSRPGSEAARRALAGMPSGSPIVLVGSYGDCGYTTAIDWPERPEWKLVPPSRSSALPVVERIDDHTILAVAASGFAMPVEKVTPSPPWASPSYGATVRQTAVPVEAVRSGRQQIDGALVEVVSRRASEIRGLRFSLNRPLKDYIFLFAAGCGAMKSVAGADLPDVVATRSRSEL
jgi:hypothetical protein